MPTLVAVDKIQAALEKPEMVAHRQAIHAAGLTIDHVFTKSELDEKIRCSSLSIAQRIALKGALYRAGLVQQ